MDGDPIVLKFENTQSKPSTREDEELKEGR